MAKLAQVATARQAQLKDGRRLGFVEFGDPQGKPVILLHEEFSGLLLPMFKGQIGDLQPTFDAFVEALKVKVESGG